MSERLPIFALTFLLFVAPVPSTAQTKTGGDPIRAAEQALQQKSADELYRISRNRRLFESKTEEEKERLREFHQQLVSHPHADKLQQVIRQYYRWLIELDEQQRAEVMDLPPEKRIRRIIEIRRQQEIDWLGKIGPTRLPKEDAVPVYLWFEEMIKNKGETIIARAIEWHDQGMIPFDNRLIELAKRRQHANMGPERTARMRRNIASYLLFKIQEDYPEQISELFADDEFDNLKPYLSQRAQAILEERLPSEQGLLVLRWLADAKRIQRENSIPTERLETFAETHLSPDARDELDALTSEARRQKLIELYNKWQRSRKSGAF